MRLFVNNKTANRILWIDFAKVIGILLLYLGHQRIPGFAQQYIFAFHMPLFFFLSGYLEKRRAIRENIIHGIKGIIIPYILLYCLLWVTWIPSRILFHKDLFDGKSITYVLFINPLLGIISGLGINIANSTVIFGQSWFLITLFYIKIIHGIFLNVFKKQNPIIYLCVTNIAIFALLFLLRRFDVDNILHVRTVVMAFPFFSIGYYIHTINPLKNIALKIKNDTFLRILIIVILFYVVALLSFCNGYAAINAYNFGRNLFLYYITAFLAIVLVYCVSIFYEKINNVITIISSGTIFIMALELPFMGIILRLSGTQYQEAGFIILTGVSIIALLLTVFPLKIVHRYFPILIGGRKITIE